jgi:hypothetical protein
VLDTLAAAYAEAGRFDDAVKTAARAIGLASEGKDAELLPRIESRRKLYAQRQAYRAG